MITQDAHEYLADQDQDNPCEGCIYSVENDCGQGREYGKPTNCYEDLN